MPGGEGLLSHSPAGPGRRASVRKGLGSQREEACGEASSHPDRGGADGLPLISSLNPEEEYGKGPGSHPPRAPPPDLGSWLRRSRGRNSSFSLPSRCCKLQRKIWRASVPSARDKRRIGVSPV